MHHVGKSVYCVEVNSLGALIKVAKSDYWSRHVLPSVRMEQLGSQWSDFHGIFMKFHI